MLQARFATVSGCTHLVKEEEIGVIMRTCVILHNMIVEDEQDNYEFVFDYDVVEGTAPGPIVNHDHHPCYKTYFQRSKEICDPNTHVALQADLIEKIWKRNLGRKHRLQLNNARIIIFLNVQLW